MEQPTNQELRIALRIAKVFAGTAQAGPALHDLKRVRDRRTTWFDTEELALRKELDCYIAQIRPTNGSCKS
jgi:hypothetical protein